ncbi:hypothetical protein LZ30DRAFT_763652 [Colletotrichum cereale]|nr:hypothetical protein LZ30DRAFT_763652 [Colletotrichum cereale]
MNTHLHSHGSNFPIPPSAEAPSQYEIAVSRGSTDVEHGDKKDRDGENNGDLISSPSSTPVDSGVTTIETAQKQLDGKGRWMVVLGEFDNATIPVYNNYAASSFGALSKLVTVRTADSVLFAVINPPMAKLSNVIGRGEAYIISASSYNLEYTIMASSATFNAYAPGLIFYIIGQSGMAIMNDILVADITTARWRGFAISLMFIPYLITPWATGFIVDDVVKPGGIGWRWAIGMFAILQPIGSALIISTLLYHQRKTKKACVVQKQKTTLYSFCSQVDLGGSALLCAGFAILLIPLTLAANSPSKWGTPYIIALMVFGSLVLAALPQKAQTCRHANYLRNKTIVICLFLVTSDSIGVFCTHTYIYSWETVARNFTARDATFLQHTQAVMQCVVGITAGLGMAYTRRYKWLLVSGVAVRLIGYGLMSRPRDVDDSVAELFVVQLIQGMGADIINSQRISMELLKTKRPMSQYVVYVAPELTSPDGTFSPTS